MRLSLLSVLTVLGCGLTEPGIPARLRFLGLDLAAPLPTASPFGLLFSADVHQAAAVPERFALVPYRLGTACKHQLQCGGDKCLYGRCQHSAVDGRFVADLVNLPLSDRRRSQTAPITVTTDGARLWLRPVEPLSPGRLHQLLVGPGLRGGAGEQAALDENGLMAALTVVTERRSGPSVRLISPVPNSATVPTNLKRIVLRWEGAPRLPVAFALVDGHEAVHHLVAANSEGDTQTLVLKSPLQPNRVWQLEARCRQGAACPLPLVRQEMFVTAAGPDHVAPLWRSADMWRAGPCVHIKASSSEPADLLVRGTGMAMWWRHGSESYAVARIVEAPVMGRAELMLEDRSGNRSEARSFDLAVPRLARVVLSEVMPNPSGPEPQQEYAELFNAGVEPVQLAGYTLEDGDASYAVTLPAVALVAGGRALVVGRGFDPTLVDLAPHAALVSLDAVLGQSGLSNRGEPLRLRDPLGNLVSSYGGWVDVSGRKTEGHSVVRVDPLGCDIGANWAIGPGGGTPGAR